MVLCLSRALAASTGTCRDSRAADTWHHTLSENETQGMGMTAMAGTHWLIPSLGSWQLCFTILFFHECQNPTISPFNDYISKFTA